MKIKVLFVCHGNICRSKMAEYIFKDMINKKGLDDKFIISSSSISSEEIGNPIYYKAKEKLDSLNIKYDNKGAKQITKEELNYYDYIIVMDENNLINIKNRFGNVYNNKIYKLLSFANINNDVLDPWYTRDFDKCYLDIKEGLEYFIKYLGL